jgi:hypothetical protein
MEPLDLEPIKKRLAVATEGPWRLSGGYVWTLDANGRIHNTINSDGYEGEIHPNDGEFIAHAREDVPTLIAEVERLRDAIDRGITWLEKREHLAAWDRLTETRNWEPQS